jgi:cobalt-zinc-cadmium efflux system protein
MTHDEHSHSRPQSGNLGLAFLLNVSFTALEIVGGLWTNSIAIVSDALHDLGDSFSLGFAWYVERLSRQQADEKFTYGYRRFSTLGALVTSVVLMAGLGYILWQAVGRLGSPEEVNAPGMLGLAVVGILFNGYAAWRLHGGSSLNERVASWHLLEDTLGWAAVLVGSAIMMAWEAPIIDPILSLLIALFVLWNVFRNLKKVALVFLQSAPQGFDAGAFGRELASWPGVAGVHSTNTWTLDGESHVFSTHLVLAAGSDRGQIMAAKRRVHELLRGQDFVHITVDVELEGEACAAEADH